MSISVEIADVVLLKEEFLIVSGGTVNSYKGDLIQRLGYVDNESFCVWASNNKYPINLILKNFGKVRCGKDKWMLIDLAGKGNFEKLLEIEIDSNEEYYQSLFSSS